MKTGERRTDDGLAALVDLERDFGVADEEGEVEDVLDGLGEAVGIHHQFEEIDVGDFG
jgi:hypothetical protein